MSSPMIHSAGIGLRNPHTQCLLEERPSIGFLEAHTENYMGGGLPKRQLCALAEHYPISLHGVGLSLGRADGLDLNHLDAVVALAKDIHPLFISEHLSWSAYSHVHVPDLLPVPLTHEALGIFVQHIDQFQEALGREILIENPSNYLAFKQLDYDEAEFLNILVERTGCGLLLDINNIAVSAHNLGYNAMAYLNRIKADGRVKQYHLAGYQINDIGDGQTVYIDTHGAPVYPAVWELYGYALKRFGDVPTLIEWDSDLPPLETLLGEAEKANQHRLHFLAQEASRETA